MFERLENALAAADQYRKDEQKQGGFVFVLDGQAQGWESEIGSPSCKRKGTLAVADNGWVWVAHGSDDTPETWEIARQPSGDPEDSPRSFYTTGLF